MSDSNKKKPRGPNFSSIDRALLLNIVEGYMNIIENKKTDAVWSKEKEKAWADIAVDFNRCSSEGERTATQLKTAYENYKRRIKKAAADDKVRMSIYSLIKRVVLTNCNFCYCWLCSSYTDVKQKLLWA